MPFVWYLKAASLTIGPTRLWLHFLPLLSGFCSVGYLLAIAAMRHWRQKPESRATKLLTMKSGLRLSKRIPRETASELNRSAVALKALGFAAASDGPKHQHGD